MLFSSRAAIEQNQLEKLRRMLDVVLSSNGFYRRKLGARCVLSSLADFSKLPVTTKSELVQDQLEKPPFGGNLTFPMERYIRVHQTSGTTGRPMYWLDTEESWEWWAGCWKTVFQAAGLGPGERIYFAFSFGPFVGFWAGWEGARKLGAMAISGGSQSTAQRLKSMIEQRATVLVSTPTYALHMASEARKAAIDLARDSSIRVTIHAGEPGASIPSTKKIIEESWGARCFDHAGATEAGAFGFGCESQATALHVNEDEFIAEVIDPQTGEKVKEGDRGELVITNLGRYGSPVIRYRTGDWVVPNYETCPCGRSFLRFEGGVLGRVDDMIIVRGVNIFPGAIENVVREFPEVEEFRVEVFTEAEMKEIKLLVEPRADSGLAPDLEEKIIQCMRQRVGLRPQVEVVQPGTLPRFELKAKRVVMR